MGPLIDVFPSILHKWQLKASVILKEWPAKCYNTWVTQMEFCQTLQCVCVCVYYTRLCYFYMNIYSICCTINCVHLVALCLKKHSKNISNECDSKHSVTQRTIMCVNRSISILHHLPHSRLMAKDPLWCRIFFHLTANWTGHLSHSVSVLTLSLLGCQSKQEIQNA